MDKPETPTLWPFLHTPRKQVYREEKKKKKEKKKVETHWNKMSHTPIWSKQQKNSKTGEEEVVFIKKKR